MSKLFLSKKQRTLLLQSDVLKDYPWILEMLANNTRITEDLVDALPHDQKTTLRNMKDSFLKQAVGEWIGKEDLSVEDKGPHKDNWLRCSLCGTPNRLIFYIYNMLNEKSLNVGGECVKEFGINLSKPGMTYEQLVKNARRLYRLNTLDKEIPGIKRLVETWDHYLESLPIIIPLKLEMQYTDCGNKIKRAYGDFLDKKANSAKDAAIIAGIREELKARDEVCKAIDRYIKENRDTKYVPTRETALWLERNGQRSTIQMLKEDGIITWRTAYRIEEPRFLDSLVLGLNEALNSLGVIVERADSRKVGYVMRLAINRDIRLICRHRKLLLDYGYLLFGGDPISPITIKSIVELGDIYDEASRDAVMRELSRQAEGVGIKIVDYNSDFDEALIRYSGAKLFVIVKMSTFASKLKHLAFGLGKPDEITEYINSVPGKRYSEEDLKKYEIPSWRYSRVI